MNVSKRYSIFLCALFCAFIGLFAALIVTGSMRSMNITESRELFLYRQIHRNKRETNKSGGSSTHTSSSGRTHGGSSGNF